MEEKPRSAKAIAWDIRYGLPTNEYLEFVRSRMPDEFDNSVIDPFSIDLLDPAGAYFVERRLVEDEVKYPGNRIILGGNGSGKTTLFKRLHRLIPADTLIVRLPLNEDNTIIPEVELQEGKVSTLTPNTLSQYIFDAYWKHFVINRSKRLEYYPLFRQYRYWTKRFQWFYQKHHPYQTEILDEFELMSWIQNRQNEVPFEDSILAEEQLREIVDWVTFDPGQERYLLRTSLLPPLPPLYKNILVIVDDTESLSAPAVVSMLNGVQRLFNLHLGQLSIKLFVNDAWQSLVEEMQSVRDGRIAIFRLPEWTPEELRQLLLLRWNTISKGDYTPSSIAPGIKLGDLMGDALDPKVRGKFLDLIIKNAIECSQPNHKLDGLDAPIHSLKIARAFVAACSGCWAKWGFTLPLSETQLQKLADEYRGMSKEEK